VFRPSHVLKTRINGGTASDADDDG
jgi:hypothetical protein